MLVGNSHWLVGIAICPGRQSIIASVLPSGKAENQGSQVCQEQTAKQKDVQKKVKEKEVAGQKLLLQSLTSLVVCICG